MKAWLFQDHRQKERFGDKAAWSVGWIDPAGKRKSRRIGCRSAAEKFARKTEGQLASGTYEAGSRKTWEQFMVEYESKVLALMEPGTREGTQFAINHFERIIKPVRMSAIDSRAFAGYVAKRKAEPRTKRMRTAPRAGEPVTLVSKATVNRELRSLRSIVRKAHRWGYLARVPEIEFLKEDGKIPTYVTPEHFATIYKACDGATLPEGQPYDAADWWRGVLVFAYMTGWRIGSILALQWQDVDLDKGRAFSQAADNKGRRDQLVPLHPLVVQHLRKLTSFGPLVFPWGNRREVFTAFTAIQKAAGVSLVGRRDHYGFHDLRRGFATLNADRMTADALQAIMQHRDYQTTQRYINMARQLNPAVANLYVPELQVETA